MKNKDHSQNKQPATENQSPSPSSNAGDRTKNTEKNENETECQCKPKPKILGMTIFEFITSGLAVIGLSIAALTAGFIRNQLMDARKDQRPWLQIVVDGKPAEQQPQGVHIFGVARILNTGKTPAKNINVRFYMERLDSQAEPRLAESTLDHTFTTGIIFPNSPFDCHSLST